VSLREYAEAIIVNYDEKSDFYSKEVLRELCGLVAAITTQVDWILQDIVTRTPDKSMVISVSSDEVDTMKLYSEMVNDWMNRLDKFNVSFKEH
jgi:hypothetical protein